MATHLSTPEEALARRLLRLSDRGALATVIDPRSPAQEFGLPYASLVLVASDLDGSPILMLSDLADHSRNIAADQRVSLLLARASNAEGVLQGLIGTGTITIQRQREGVDAKLWHGPWYWRSVTTAR